MSRRRVGGLDLWVEAGGSGAPVLLLCHGMSGTGAAWDGMRPHLEADWPGRWIIPDLRGHGRSDHAPGYGIARSESALWSVRRAPAHSARGPAPENDAVDIGRVRSSFQPNWRSYSRGVRLDLWTAAPGQLGLR